MGVHDSPERYDTHQSQKRGRKLADEHGYMTRAPGRDQCRNCEWSGEEKDTRVPCRMFGFRAQAGGTCDEHEPRR